MINNTNIQQTGRVDIHKRCKPSRLHMALAGFGVASTLLIGGLSGFHSGSVAPHGQVTPSHRAVVSSQDAGSAQKQVITVSYRTSADYMSIARQAAVNAGISPDYFVRQIQQESGFNPNAGSPAGAQGIAQFMPATAASLGINPYDPVQALDGAARLMASLNAQFGGNYAKALAAYNAGAGAVNSAVAQGGGNWLSYMPAETRNYVAVIMG